ncbi:MAG: arginase family protein [Dehalococcoidia bacterium]
MTQQRGVAPEPSYIGLPTFLKLPYVATAEELRQAKPDIAILGAPVDMGTTIRPGTRFGPRAIRLASRPLPRIE